MHGQHLFDIGITLIASNTGGENATHGQLLTDIGIAVIAATLLGLVAHWLRQPILLGYLLAGALIGNQVGFKIVETQENIEIISEMGLVLLLFIIGLELNIKAVLASGKQLLVAGFGQFLVCLLLGVGVFAVFGYGLSGDHADGLYLAIMCGLSSTAIVVKMLYDKGELDTLPGRLTLGVLVIQDIYAIFVLAFQPNFANPTVGPILQAMLSTVGLLVAGFLVSKYLLRWVFSSIAKNPEMVLAVSIGWCAAVAAIASALHLSKEMGALVAGLSIAAFPYSIHVTAKTLPLRDFFLTLFFVSLGMKITTPTWGMVLPVGGVVLFVVLSRFLSVYPLVKFSGGGHRAAFVSSLNLAQISEFSLVIASLGVQYKHISQGTVAIVIYAMAIMAVLSSYMIRYSHPLYTVWSGFLGGEEDFVGDAGVTKEHDIVLLGCHRAARSLIESLEKTHPHLMHRLLVIDFNPVTLEELKAKGVHGIFGDISSMDTLSHAHLNHATAIISAIPDMLLKGIDNIGLVKMCKSIAPHSLLVATGDDARHEQKLRAEGAGFVVRPYDLAGERLATLLIDLPEKTKHQAEAAASSAAPSH
jgi:Kef-type K+ transport system membrane component KefB